jgi:hypothetical protein
VWTYKGLPSGTKTFLVFGWGCFSLFVDSIVVVMLIEESFGEVELSLG